MVYRNGEVVNNENDSVAAMLKNQQAAFFLKAGENKDESIR